MTATLVHTSSRMSDNAVRIARVAAGARTAAARINAERVREIREAHARAVATEWVAEIVTAGAVKVGFKVCDDLGKYRFVLPVGNAAESLVSHWGMDVEAWGVSAAGEYVGEVW